jgi:predicted enzyme involved in methoxymalonyl-ACP biosynthesis
MRIRDRFGDAGIVGAAVVRVTGATGDIDTFLLSCRVIGRTVETALLAVIADEARAAGATQLTGRFIQTSKNAPARDFYRTHGFTEAGAEGDATRWTRDLTTAPLTVPDWITCEPTSSSRQHAPTHP